MPVRPVTDADTCVEQLYAAHWRSLVRLSVLLVRDVGTAEEVVQDAFVAMHGRWSKLRDPDKALAYLRQAVVNRSRSALRHRAVVERHVRREGGLVVLPEAGESRLRCPHCGHAGPADLRILNASRFQRRELF